MQLSAFVQLPSFSYINECEVNYEHKERYYQDDKQFFQWDFTVNGQRWMALISEVKYMG